MSCLTKLKEVDTDIGSRHIVNVFLYYFEAFLIHVKIRKEKLLQSSRILNE